MSKRKDGDFIGAIVQYEYNAPALSCCWNGRRLKGTSKVVDEDVGGGLCLANGRRIFQNEVVKVVKAGEGE